MRNVFVDVVACCTGGGGGVDRRLPPSGVVHDPDLSGDDGDCLPSEGAAVIEEVVVAVGMVPVVVGKGFSPPPPPPSSRNTRFERPLLWLLLSRMAAFNPVPTAGFLTGTDLRLFWPRRCPPPDDVVVVGVG